MRPDHPAAPQVDRVALAEAEPRPAGPAGPGLPAEGRDVRRAGGRVRGGNHDGLAVRGGGPRPARDPGAEAPPGGPGREEGWVRLRGPGRHPDPHRPGRRRPALLLRQAQEARNGPAGHRQLRRGCPVGVRGAAGSVHDKKAEWIWDVLAELEAAGLVTLADKGYQGSSYAKIPYRGKNKPESQKQANRAHAKLRAPGERANAQLKAWRILRKLRCCPWRAGQLAKAIHALPGLSGGSRRRRPRTGWSCRCARSRAIIRRRGRGQDREAGGGTVEGLDLDFSSTARTRACSGRLM